jgi:hypothetical protein
MTHSPSNACKTHTTGAAMTMKDTTSVLKGPSRRHLEALCAMLVSQGIFER